MSTAPIYGFADNWASALRVFSRSATDALTVYNAVAHAPAQEGPLVSRAGFRCCACTGVPFIYPPAPRLARSGTVDCCCAWRASALWISAWSAAGRPVLRHERALGLHSVEAVRAAPGASGGSCICLAYPRNFLVSRGACWANCLGEPVRT